MVTLGGLRMVRAAASGDYQKLTFTMLSWLEQMWYCLMLRTKQPDMLDATSQQSLKWCSAALTFKRTWHLCITTWTQSL